MNDALVFDPASDLAQTSRAGAVLCARAGQPDVIDAVKPRLDVRLDDPLIVWALRGFEWRLRRADRGSGRKSTASSARGPLRDLRMLWSEVEGAHVLLTGELGESTDG